MVTLTSILSTDTLTASRSTLNTNFANLNSGFPSVLSLQPFSAQPVVGQGNFALTGNTTAWVGLYQFPAQILVNSFSLQITSVRTAGAYNIAWYTESGQTLLNSITTGNLASNGLKTINVSSVLLGPGNVYTLITPVDSVDTNLSSFTLTNTSVFPSIIGKPVYAGVQSITANTVPTTITPSSLNPFTPTTPAVMAYRLDN